MLLAQREVTRTLQRDGVLTPWVFHRADGSRIQTFRKAWRTACRQAGCPGRIFHDLRRTAVRNLERAGISRSVAMKMVGHKTEEMYRRYAIVSENDLSRAAQQLDQASTGILSGILRHGTGSRTTVDTRISEENVGWVTGFEPATSGATVRRSTPELHPPSEDRRRCPICRGGDQASLLGYPITAFEMRHAIRAGSRAATQSLQEGVPRTPPRARAEDGVRSTAKRAAPVLETG